MINVSFMNQNIIQLDSEKIKVQTMNEGSNTTNTSTTTDKMKTKLLVRQYFISNSSIKIMSILNS